MAFGAGRCSQLMGGRCPGLIKMVPEGTADWLHGEKVCRLIWRVLKGKCLGQPLETQIWDVIEVLRHTNPFASWLRIPA